MFKYYILTSSRLSRLARQFETLRPNDVIVVINTLDKEYEKEASAFCEKHSLQYYITESDGTPSTGKNSVLRLFLESDNQYMVHVDGDDMITRYGRNLYRTVAHQSNPPDVICLYNQLAMHVHRRGLWDKQYDSNTVNRDEWYIPAELQPRYPHDYTSHAHFQKLPLGKLAYSFKMTYGLTDEKAKEWAEKRKEMVDYFMDYSDRDEGFCRMVFFSRKAASMMSYDPSLVIGEDTYQQQLLRKLAARGEIDMRIRNERWAFSYVHYNDTGSITRDFNEDGTLNVDMGWMWPLMDALNKLKDDYPTDYSLPEFIDPHYEIK